MVGIRGRKGFQPRRWQLVGIAQIPSLIVPLLGLSSFSAADLAFSIRMQFTHVLAFAMRQI